MSASQWVHIEVLLIKRETRQAFLVSVEDHDDMWIPKSQISDADYYGEGDQDVTLSVTSFIAREKGLD